MGLLIDGQWHDQWCYVACPLSRRILPVARSLSGVEAWLIKALGGVFGVDGSSAVRY